MHLVLNTTYYPVPAYEFNLPAGHSCPYAKDCKCVVLRKSGRMIKVGKKFRCYASAAERYPGVRKSRWENFDWVKGNKPINLPSDAQYVRIHASGDFWSQEYFDRWLKLISKHPKTFFWAYTKSLPFWVARLGEIPPNFLLTASYGGLKDELIEEYDLKSVRVFQTSKQAEKAGLPIDTDDALAMSPQPHKFALVDVTAKYTRKYKYF